MTLDRFKIPLFTLILSGSHLNPSFANQSDFPSFKNVVKDIKDNTDHRNFSKDTEKDYFRLNGNRISNHYFLFLRFKKQLFGLEPRNSFLAAAFRANSISERGRGRSPLKDIPIFTAIMFNKLERMYYNTDSSLPKLFSTRIDFSRKEPHTSYILPALGHHSSGFGMRWGRMHNGIDIANATGTPIIASKAGRVMFAGWDNGYGHYVEILHSDRSRARYAHLSKIMVQQNQVLETGQRLGLMGSSGRSTGPHLHFEIIKSNGEHLDPHSVMSITHDDIALSLN